MLYQSSTNAVRQDFQALIKQWWEEIGVAVELKNIDASVFFGGDPGSPDTFQKFYADVEMYANNFDGTDPQSYLDAYRCGNEPNPANGWQGENINRFCDPAYDALLDELAQTAVLEERGRIAKALNDKLTKEIEHDHPARRPRPRLGPLEHAGRRGAQHLGQRALERRRLVPDQVMT